MQTNTIHGGDCIKGLKKLPAGCIHLAFADPPFNIGYQYDVYKDNKDYHAYLKWSQRWMGEVCRVLKPNGTFWLAIGDEYAAELKLLAQNELQLTCRSWVIWYYTFGVNCTKKFTRSHAHLFQFVKDPSDFTFNEDEVCVPSARQLVYADARAVPSGRLPDDTWILRPQDVPQGFTTEQSTWYFSRVAGTFKERAGFHGCQMPEQLLGRIIRTSSHPGDMVLDPFAGSGTTLAAARKLGRQWLGFELSTDYRKQAVARIQRAEEGQPLDGPPEPVMSAPRTPGLTSKVWLRSGVERAIVEAFLAARGKEGWSCDRVIADPELNERYCHECADSNLPGSAKDWNIALARLRDAGKLKRFPEQQVTAFPDDVVDEYLFASEIAMRQVGDETGLNLDEILCDPHVAQRLDEIAYRWAPGFTKLHYRWGAVMIRDRAGQSTELSRQLAHSLGRRKFTEFKPAADIPIKRLGRLPGVYLAKRPRCNLYVGETIDLGKRLERQLHSTDWGSGADQLEIGIIKLDGIGGCEKDRWGLQARLIARYEPILNYRELGEA